MVKNSTASGQNSVIACSVGSILRPKGLQAHQVKMNFAVLCLSLTKTVFEHKDSSMYIIEGSKTSDGRRDAQTRRLCSTTRRGGTVALRAQPYTLKVGWACVSDERNWPFRR